MDAFQNGEAVAELGVLGGELVQTELLLRVKETNKKGGKPTSRERARAFR